MSLKQKLLELKRFRVLTNIESSISKGEKITRKDYVETVKLLDVVTLLDEATKQVREDSFDTFVPIGEDEQEIVVVVRLKDVLSVLEGVERE